MCECVCSVCVCVCVVCVCVCVVCLYVVCVCSVFVCSVVCGVVRVILRSACNCRTVREEILTSKKNFDEFDESDNSSIFFCCQILAS